MVRITAPDDTDWSIEPVPITDGVGLTVGFLLNGEPLTLKLDLDRASSRELARGILRAGGDATERTFPQPPIPEVGRG